MYRVVRMWLLVCMQLCLELFVLTLHVIIKPGEWNWEIRLGGWIRPVWTADLGGEIPSKSQIRLLETMLTLLDVRQEIHFFVISIFTISMCQNCSISFWADPGGAKKKFEDLAHPRYNCDMQSTRKLFVKICTLHKYELLIWMLNGFVEFRMKSLKFYQIIDSCFYMRKII